MSFTAREYLSLVTVPLLKHSTAVKKSSSLRHTILSADICTAFNAITYPLIVLYLTYQ